MLNGAVARRYARALMDLASGNDLDRVERDLRDVRDCLSKSSDLKSVLFHPAIVGAEKRKLVERVFGDAVSPLTLNFLRLLVERRRETAIEGIAEEFSRLVNETKNLVDAEVTTAYDLNKGELNRLRDRLAKLTGKTVVLKTAVDAKLIGGVVVKIGDQIIDGSIASKLSKMHDSLKQIQVRG